MFKEQQDLTEDKRDQIIRNIQNDFMLTSLSKDSEGARLVLGRTCEAIGITKDVKQRELAVRTLADWAKHVETFKKNLQKVNQIARAESKKEERPDPDAIPRLGFIATTAENILNKANELKFAPAPSISSGPMFKQHKELTKDELGLIAKQIPKEGYLVLLCKDTHDARKMLRSACKAIGAITDEAQKDSTIEALATRARNNETLKSNLQTVMQAVRDEETAINLEDASRLRLIYNIMERVLTESNEPTPPQAPGRPRG